MKRIRHKKKKRRINLFKRRILTETEYKKLRGEQQKLFREESKKLKNEEFIYEVYQERNVKTRKGIRKRYIRIPTEKFQPGKNYHIWIKHRPTGQRRVLGIGKFDEIPTKSHRQEKFGRQLGGRYFNPKLKTPKKARGKWIPTQKIMQATLNEMNELAKEERIEVRGAIIPTKRFFHPVWKIFADKPLSKKTRFHKVLVNCVIHYIYRRENFISKHGVILEFSKRGVTINTLLKVESKIEKRINNDLEFLHPKADEISVLEINGYVPLGV